MIPSTTSCRITLQSLWYNITLNFIGIFSIEEMFSSNEHWFEIFDDWFIFKSLRIVKWNRPYGTSSPIPSFFRYGKGPQSVWLMNFVSIILAIYRQNKNLNMGFWLHGFLLCNLFVSVCINSKHVFLPYFRLFSHLFFVFCKIVKKSYV